MIKTRNLSNAIDSFFEEKKDWLECFTLLKENTKINNFKGLFIYHLIRKQVDVKDFEVVFKEIVKKSEPWELKQIYRSFFNTGNDLGIEKYLEKNRYNNDLSDIQNMHFIFITIESNKIALEPTSVEYLKVIFSHNINALVDSGISPFFYDLACNLSSLKPILKNLQNVPNGNRLLIPIFHAISRMSYELPESVSKASYNILIQTIPDIQSEFENNLVYQKTHPEPGVEIDPTLMNFFNIAQADVTKMINNRYQKEYEKILLKPVDVSNVTPHFHIYYQEEPFVKLAISISASIEICYKNNTSIDLSQINITQSALQNFVYLKTLEVKLKNNEVVKAPLELCDYISAIHKIEKAAVIPSISSFLNLEMMSAKILHSRLDSNLGEKSSTTKKPKI